MNWSAMIFWALATIAVVPGFFLITSRNIVHMSFWLLSMLSGIAGLYLYMGADFLGMTQVFVYIGGINVLLLFGIMLTNNEPVFVRKVAKRPALLPALLLGGVLFFGLMKAITGTTWRSAPQDVEPTAKSIGAFLLSDYVLPFEIVSILLLVVLVGAAFIARRTSSERGD